jgi:iron complex outermembrane recepter protein
MSNSSIQKSVRLALATAATASLGHVQTAIAQEQQTGAESMDEVIVTGSRIRRVDAESASPVLTIDAAQIEKSGVTSTGDLLQRLPTISGAATNPAVNNGGGFGEANVELRGLDARRTLVLLNGRRLGLVGASDATDINLLPVNLIERVDVLKEGAGAIYGSDAIAGVVNFITRKDIDGAELTATYGETGEKDGKSKGVNLVWGTSGDKFHFTLNGNYTQQDAVSAGDREFSKFALYLYSGSIQKGGSSRTPTGRIFLPAGTPGIDPAIAACGSVTRVAGAAGSSQGDYRCFAGAPDRYNYQPWNLVMTPQERGSIFANFDYEINDAVTMYAELLYSRTSSGFQIAPLPFDAVADDVVVSADSMYNPFGIDFGGILTGNPNLLVRLEALGTRHSSTASDAKVAKLGLKGGLFGTEWNWDLMVGYSRLDQTASVSGYLYQPALTNAFGPSFSDAGVPTCGTPLNPIPVSQCTPVNIFNLGDPAQVTALGTISSGYDTDRQYTSKQASLSFDGKVFSMPAGDALASVEFDYLQQRGVFNVDYLITAQPPLYLNCLLAQETCSGPSSGEYDSKDVSVELFIPLLKDLPGVHALNITLGSRYSDYSLFGTTTNSTIKLEYRPVKDLLVRATYAEVFRAPTILDISAAPTNNSSTFTDPCVGLTEAQVTANPNLALACVGVVRDGTFTQPNGQVTGLLTSNPELDPETGDVTTFGLVWQPSFANSLSVNVDFWKYKIEDTITQLDTNFAMTQCVATGASASFNFCDLVHRFTSGATAGQVFVFEQPTFNLGSLKTDGVDVGARYSLRETAAGTFNFQLDWTHTNSYDNVPSPGAAVVEVAGTFDRQFGNYAKDRAVATVGWNMAKFDAQLTARYIAGIQLLHPDGANPDPNPPLDIPAFTYLDLYFGYSISDSIKVSLSAQNLADKQAPLLYQNNVTNANTDVNTYDTIGRRYSVTANYKF